MEKTERPSQDRPVSKTALVADRVLMTPRLIMFSIGTICRMLIYVGIVFLYSHGAGHAMQGDVPYHAAQILQRSYLLIEKKEIDQSIALLTRFRKDGEKELTSGASDKKGYTHYLIDFTLANCYLMSDRISSAVPFYESTVEKNPRFSPAWINLAKCYCDQLEYEQAAVAFGNAYDTLEVKRPDILYYGAVAWMAADRHEQALAVFDRLLRNHINDVKLEWKESLVQAYLNANLPAKALPVIEELAEKSSEAKRRQWQEVLLYQYINLDMNHRALEYARHLTREYPVEAKWWKALAHLHLAANRYETGLVALTVYGLLTPLTDEEKKLMAELSTAAGVPIQAVRFYEDILSRTRDVDLLKRIAETYRSMNRAQDALRWVEKGLEHSREEDLLMMKGHLLYEMKAYREAMDVFNLIPEGNHSGQAQLMAGYAALNVDDFDGARRALEKASHYSKQKKTALELLRQLSEMTMN